MLNTPRKLVVQDIRHAVKNKRTLGKVPRIISSVCLRPSNVATGKSFWERLEQVTQAIAFKHVFKGMVCKSKSLALWEDGGRGRHLAPPCLYGIRYRQLCLKACLRFRYDGQMSCFQVLSWGNSCFCLEKKKKVMKTSLVFIVFMKEVIIFYLHHYIKKFVSCILWKLYLPI